MGVPALRRAGNPGDPAVLLVHGYPESSYMWRPALEALAARGLYAVAPDLPGYGDAEPDPPGTWERHVEALERIRVAEGLERVALVGHDWGGLIGLRWACDHPDALWAVVAVGHRLLLRRHAGTAWQTRCARRARARSSSTA